MSGSRPKPAAICLLFLEILLCIAVYFICVCIRRRRRHNRWFRTRTTVQTAVIPFSNSSTARSGPRGLDPAVVSSFPVIPYTTLKNVKPDESLDCAVCLSSFQEDETLRFIPKCEHVFHPQCVDPWFALHTTCPYCRANLATSSSVDLISNGSDPVQGDPVRTESSTSGEVVILVTVTNEISRRRTAEAPESGRYTLRLTDDIWRNIVPGNSDDRRVLKGENCPPMGRRGTGDDED